MSRVLFQRFGSSFGGSKGFQRKPLGLFSSGRHCVLQCFRELLRLEGCPSRRKPRLNHRKKGRTLGTIL